MGSTFRFRTTSDTSPSAGYIDVPITSASVDSLGGSVSGVGTNTTKNKVYGPFEVFAACLDSQARLYAIGISQVNNEDTAAPGQQLSFSTEFDFWGGSSGAKGGCKHTLVSMVGSTS